MGLLAAAGAKATVQGMLDHINHCGKIALDEASLVRLLTRNTTADFLVNMSASADVLAQAKVEIDLAVIPEGKNVSMHPVLL